MLGDHLIIYPIQHLDEIFESVEKAGFLNDDEHFENVQAEEFQLSFMP